jgi:hypothetical protein
VREWEIKMPTVDVGCERMLSIDVSYICRSLVVTNHVLCPYMCDFGEVVLVFFNVSVMRLESR